MNYSVVGMGDNGGVGVDEGDSSIVNPLFLPIREDGRGGMPQRTDILGVISISISRHEPAVSIRCKGKGRKTPRKIQLSAVVSVSFRLKLKSSLSADRVPADKEQ